MSASLDLYYIDIDGVVADDRHRQHFITNPVTKSYKGGKYVNGKWVSNTYYSSYSTPDYDGYFGDMALDSVWDEGRSLYEKCRIVPGTVTGFLTGRRVDTRAITNRWLRTKGFEFDPELLVMKPMGLTGKLAQFKLEVIKADLAAGWNSVTMYDDDPRVIDLINDYALETGAPVEGMLCEWHVKPKSMQFAGKA